MPALDLGNWREDLGDANPVGFSSHYLLSTMYYPNDPNKRKEYLSKLFLKAKDKTINDLKEKWLVNGIKNLEDKYKIKAEKVFGQKKWSQKKLNLEKRLEQKIQDSFKEDYKKTGGDESVISGKAWDKIITEAAQNSVKGVIAGCVLNSMIRLEEHWENGGSLNKAFHLTEGIFGKSTATIRRFWKEFKTVSPLWVIYTDVLMIDGDSEDPEDKDVLELFDPLIPENLPLFLGYAEVFRLIGETHTCKGQTEPILKNCGTWTPPEGFPIFEIDKFHATELSDDEISIMEKYIAPQDVRNT